MASTYLTRSISSTSNRQTLTISVWVKRSALSSGSQFRILTARSGSDQNWFSFDNDTLILGHYNGSSYQYRNITNRLFRDSSAWYHIVIAIDTTQATASDRVKIYVNGVEETSFSTEVQPSLNQNTVWNTSGYTNYIGQDGTSTSYYDGSMAHFHFIDGTQYDADDFGETDATTGIWKPKTAPSVTYGTNGFFLKFENSGAFGTDSSGNANNFTVNGTMTQTIDTPSNVFATLNPLINNGGKATLSNGNTVLTDTSTNAWSWLPSTLGASSGKWYWEWKAGTIGAGLFQAWGIVNDEALHQAEIYMGSLGANGYAFNFNGAKYHNGVEESYGSVSSNDIIGCALDLDNGIIWLSVNGTWQNSATQTEVENGTSTNAMYSGIDTTKTWFAGSVVNDSTVNSINFGNGFFGTTAVSSAQNPDDGIGIFEYDVPTGYRALCTKSINAEEYS